MFGQYGIISKSQSSKELMEIAKEKEQLKIAVASCITKNYKEIKYEDIKNELVDGGYPDISNIEGVNELEDGAVLIAKENNEINVKNLFMSVSYATDEIYNYAKVTYNSGRIYYITLRNIGGVPIGSIYGKPIVENPEKPQEPEEPKIGKDNTKGTTHTKIGAGDYSFNNPVIPVGFKTVETTSASWVDEDKDGVIDDWNEGLVIEDEYNNQFVWIPVDNTNVTYGYHYKVGSTGSEKLEQSLPTGISDEETQISNYKGFYIARFEAGIPNSIDKTDKTLRNTTGVPLSKQNQIPWNYISWSNAKTSAENMYKLEDTNNKVQSTLITDRMWETATKWLEKSNLNVKSNSGQWGNYKDAAVEYIRETSNDYGVTWNDKGYYFTKSTVNQMFLLKTGHTEYTNRKNIYDLAGNLWEYTNAKYDGSNYILRGGNYSDTASSYPAAYRGYDSGTPGNYSGFRVCLFVV